MAIGRRERQRATRRRELLDAALDLFERQGFDVTTIDQIAQRADVARQTVLNHYPTKRDFVLAWGARRRAEVDSQDTTSAGSMRERLRRSFDALAAINERERPLAGRLREQMLVPQPIPPAIMHALEDGKRTGELRAGIDPHTAAEILAAVYFDTLNRWLIDDRPTPRLHTLLRRRLDAILTGLHS